MLFLMCCLNKCMRVKANTTITECTVCLCVVVTSLRAPPPLRGRPVTDTAPPFLSDENQDTYNFSSVTDEREWVKVSTELKWDTLGGWVVSQSVVKGDTSRCCCVVITAFNLCMSTELTLLRGCSRYCGVLALVCY